MIEENVTDNDVDCNDIERLPCPMLVVPPLNLVRGVADFGLML